LKPAVHNKRRLPSKTVLFHHDIARPHAAATTIQTIRNLEFKVLPHPPYSPDLTPCNSLAFIPLRKALDDHWFFSDEEVKAEVHTWIQEQPKTCSSNGLRKLMDQYKQRVELQGAYVEKQ
jgi:histone-lysine N-methyltransferase SETMAR